MDLIQKSRKINLHQGSPHIAIHGFILNRHTRFPSLTAVTHIEPDSVPNENAPVRQCHRYIKNRPGQFHYKEALEADLPIGSGEVESAHRYVIQKRLKIAGAWWKEDNAEYMLALRALRSNNCWDDYWSNLYKKAA